MKVIITKQQVAEALAKEPLFRLRPGEWMTPISSNPETCPRCAVGCVLATVLSEDSDRSFANIVCEVAKTATAGTYSTPDFFDEEDEGPKEEQLVGMALALLNDGWPVAALSVFFEGSCELRQEEFVKAGKFEPKPYTNPHNFRNITDDMVQAARADTIEFVMSHFPDTITVDINGFEPMADIKIAEA